jgi:hypothetical protein
MTEPLYTFVKGQGWIIKPLLVVPNGIEGSSTTDYWYFLDEIAGNFSGWMPYPDYDVLEPFTIGNYRWDVWLDTKWQDNTRLIYEPAQLIKHMRHFSNYLTGNPEWRTRMVRVA